MEWNSSFKDAFLTASESTKILYILKPSCIAPSAPTRPVMHSHHLDNFHRKKMPRKTSTDPSKPPKTIYICPHYGRRRTLAKALRLDFDNMHCAPDPARRSVSRLTPSCAPTGLLAMR